jgi:release factor glutamine methyltransferase
VTKRTDCLPALWRMATNNQGEKTLGGVLEGLILRLENISDTPGLDAQVLLGDVMREPRSKILAHLEYPVSGEMLSRLENRIERLEKGEPLPYVLGSWEFFGLEFEVNPDVLIPRPETELLVERALTWLRKYPEKHFAADIGTGSGCIAIALATYVPDLMLTATDISREALKIARRNAEKHHVLERINFIQTDLFPPADPQNTYSLLLANLPYIPTKTLHSLPIYGREPTLALDGGGDGMKLIRRFLASAPDYLEDDGMLLMEIEEREGSEVLSLAYDAFTEGNIHLHKDLAEHERLLEVQVGNYREMDTGDRKA